ncbi:mucin-2-like [Leucoraja erinacea]|uniref:mucin-2-like n=1 Tax=Leucoraja erinaceus TaxID=7782 RepID=UPI0024539B43|nr:mucin-2-like [Leucoraja erinacea]
MASPPFQQDLNSMASPLLQQDLNSMASPLLQQDLNSMAPTPFQQDLNSMASPLLQLDLNSMAPPLLSTGPQQYGVTTPTTGPQQNGANSPSTGSQLYDFPTPSREPQQYDFAGPSRGPQQHGLPNLSRGPQQYLSSSPSNGPEELGSPSPLKGPQQHGLPMASRGPKKHGSPSPSKRSQKHGSPTPSKGPQKQGSPTPSMGPQKRTFPVPTKGPQKRSPPSSTKAPKKHGPPSSSKSSKKHGTQGTTVLQPDYTATTQISSGNESSFLLTNEPPAGQNRQAPRKKGKSSHGRALLRNLVLPAEDIEKLYLIEESARKQRMSTTTTEPRRLKIKIRHQQTTEEPAKEEEADDEKEVEEAVEAEQAAAAEEEPSSQSDIPVLENLMKNLNQQFSKRVPTKEDIVNIQDAISRLNAVLSQSQSAPENTSRHAGLSQAPRPSTWKESAEPRTPAPRLRLRPKQQLSPELELEPVPELMLPSKAPNALGGAHFLPQAIFYSPEKPGKKAEPREEPLGVTTYRSPLRAERPLSERKGAREDKKASGPRQELHLSAPDVFPKIDQLEQLLKKAKVRFSKGSPTPGDMLHLKTAMNHLDAIVPGDNNLSRSKRAAHHRPPSVPGSSVSHFILPSDARGPSPGPSAKRRTKPLHAFPPNAREHHKPSSSSSSSNGKASAHPGPRHGAPLSGRLPDSARPARRDPAPSPIPSPKGAKRKRAGKKSNASAGAPSPVSHGQPSPSKMAPPAAAHPRRENSKEHIIRRASMFSPEKGHAPPISKRSLPNRPPGKVLPERRAAQRPRLPTEGPRPVPLANPRDRDIYRPSSPVVSGKAAAPPPRRAPQGSSKNAARQGLSGPQGLRLKFAARGNRDSFLEKRREKALSPGTQESRLQGMNSPNGPQKGSVANPSHRIHAPSPEKTWDSNPSRGLNAPSGKNVRSSKTLPGPNPPTPEKVWSSKASYRHPPPSLKSTRPTASRSFESPSFESAKSLRLSQKLPVASPENRRSSSPIRRRGPPSPDNEPLPKASPNLNPPSPKRSKSSRPPLRLPPSPEDRESSEPPLKRNPRLPGDRRASNPSHNLKFTPPGKRRPTVHLPTSREKEQLSNPPLPEIVSSSPLNSFKKSSRANGRSSNRPPILKPTNAIRIPSIGPSLPVLEDRRSSKLPDSLQKSSTGNKKSNSFNPSSAERESPNPSHFSTPSSIAITKATNPFVRLKPLSAGHRRSSQLPHGRRPVFTGTRRSTNPPHVLHASSKSSKPSQDPTPSSIGTMKSTGPSRGLSPSSTRPTHSPPSSTGSHQSSVAPQSHNPPPPGSSNPLKDSTAKAPPNTETPLPSVIRMSAGSKEKPLKLPHATHQPPLWKGKFSKLFYNLGDSASVRKRFHGPNPSPPVNGLEATRRALREPGPKRQDPETPQAPTPAPEPEAAMAKRPSNPSPGPHPASTTATVLLVEHSPATKTPRVHHVHALKTPRDRTSFFGLTTSTAPVVEVFVEPSTTATTTKIPLLETPTTTPSEDIEIILLPTSPAPTPPKQVPRLHRHSSTTLATEAPEDQDTSEVTFVEIPETVPETTEATLVPDLSPETVSPAPSAAAGAPPPPPDEEEGPVTLPTKIVPRVHHHIHSLVTPASRLSFLRITTPKTKQVLLNYTRTSTLTPTATSTAETPTAGTFSSTKKPSRKKNKHKGSKKSSPVTATPEAAAESSTKKSEHHKAASGSAKQKSHRNKSTSNVKSKKSSWGSPNPSPARNMAERSSTPSSSDPSARQSSKATAPSERSAPSSEGSPAPSVAPATRRPQSPPMNELVIQASFPSQSSPLTKRPVPRHHSSRPRPPQPAADQPSPTAAAATAEPEDEDLEELEEFDDPAPSDGPNQGFPQLLQDVAEPSPIGTPEPADGEGEEPEFLHRRARRVGSFGRPPPPDHPADPRGEAQRFTRARRTQTQWVANQPGVEGAI